MASYRFNQGSNFGTAFGINRNTLLAMMNFDLGPLPVDGVIAWVKAARRIIVECHNLKDQDHQVTADELNQWNNLLDQWALKATQAKRLGVPFRWSHSMDPEHAEYMLHSLNRLLHSHLMKVWLTPAEMAIHRPTTMAVVRAFADGLWEQGKGCQHFVDQVLTSFTAN